MPHSTEAALVFADLEDAFAALETARGSPKNVRRAFSRFIELAQNLTAAMRRDASRLGKDKWDASSFPGWTPVTELIKGLGNSKYTGYRVSKRRYSSNAVELESMIFAGFPLKSFGHDDNDKR